MTSIAYLGLGANLGDTEASCASARALLGDRSVAVLRTASLYETEPWGFRDQPWFLNTVVEIRTELEPAALLRVAQGIEREIGRTPSFRNGPRALDIDILLYDDLVMDSAALTIPHVNLHVRRFVLEPLAELAPDLQHPILKLTIEELRLAVLTTSIVRRRDWGARQS